jgi:ABC-type bacteriocin/lantibiotic exporter with double-glycine peptidase domain
MTGAEVQATTEEDLRNSTRLLKRLIVVFALIVMALVYSLLVQIKAPYLVALFAAFLVLEACASLYVIRMVGRNTDSAIDELRKRHGLTPASQLPDVGI